MRLPRFNGKMPLEAYLVQVELVTLCNRWSQPESVVHLSMALESEALAVLANQPLNNHQETRQLIMALQERFG